MIVSVQSNILASSERPVALSSVPLGGVASLLPSPLSPANDRQALIAPFARANSRAPNLRRQATRPERCLL